MSSLVFTATYNERENIEKWLCGVRNAVSDASILVIDDSSPDGTASIVERFSRADLATTLVTRRGKSGLASAHLMAMSLFLDGEWDSLVTMDADGSHLPRQIPDLLDALEGVDFVIGTRTHGGSHRANLPRRLLSKGANVAARVAIPTGFTEYTTSFRAFSRSAAEIVLSGDNNDRGYAFFIECVEQLHAAGLPMTERPIDFMDRAGGKSKIPRNQIFVSMAVLARLGAQRRLGTRGERRFR